MASKDEGPPIPAATLGVALSTPALDTALSVSTEAPPTFQAWQVDCWQWLSRKVAESELKTLHPKAHRTAGVRSFYREQNELIDAFNAHARIMNDDPATPRVPPADGLSDSETVVGRALTLSLAMNVVLACRCSLVTRLPASTAARRKTRGNCRLWCARSRRARRGQAR